VQSLLQMELPAEIAQEKTEKIQHWYQGHQSRQTMTNGDSQMLLVPWTFWIEFHPTRRQPVTKDGNGDQVARQKALSLGCLEEAEPWWMMQTGQWRELLLRFHSPRTEPGLNRAYYH